MAGEVADFRYTVKPQSTEAILSERQSTHGSFADNAAISQSIKRIFHAAPGWQALSEVQKESLEMIALKLSRILSGRADEPDHAKDIAGYATLIVKELEA